MVVISLTSRNCLPELVGAVPVESNADPDAYDGKDDAEEDKRSGFAHGLDADVDDDAHNEEETSAINAQIVI